MTDKQRKKLIDDLKLSYRQLSEFRGSPSATTWGWLYRKPETVGEPTKKKADRVLKRLEASKAPRK